MKSRILVVGSANMDFMQRMERLPSAGETRIEENYDCAFISGGKGANAALAFTRLGADCVFCACVGADANGARLKQIYADDGMDTRFMMTDKHTPTGLASVLVEEDGANRITVYPGANHKLTAEAVETAFTCYPDAVYVQMEIPDQAVIAATRFAAEQSIPVVMDAGPARADFPFDKLSPLEILSPNETEVYTYTGIRPDSAENCLRAAIRLSGMVEARYIVLKLGTRGAFVYDGKYYHILPAYDVDVVDTTAAGDVFSAALTYYYMQTKDILCAVKVANIAGAIAVTKMGARDAAPTRAEISAFMNARDIHLT